jgi:hypothetical protein
MPKNPTLVKNGRQDQPKSGFSSDSQSSFFFFFFSYGVQKSQNLSKRERIII